MLRNFWSFFDLYQCGARFPKKVAMDSFGMPLVKAAKKVISRRMNKVEEQTLTTCLTVLITELEYRTGIGRIPLSWNFVRDHIYADNNVAEYIAESLIATVKVYELQIVRENERQLARGLEWACDAVVRGVFLANPKQTSLDGVPFLTRDYVNAWQKSMWDELSVRSSWVYDELILPEVNQERLLEYFEKERQERLEEVKDKTIKPLMREFVEICRPASGINDYEKRRILRKDHAPQSMTADEARQAASQIVAKAKETLEGIDEFLSLVMSGYSLKRGNWLSLERLFREHRRFLNETVASHQETVESLIQDYPGVANAHRGRFEEEKTRAQNHVAEITNKMAVELNALAEAVETWLREHAVEVISI